MVVCQCTVLLEQTASWDVEGVEGGRPVQLQPAGGGGGEEGSTMEDTYLGSCLSVTLGLKKPTTWALSETLGSRLIKVCNNNSEAVEKENPGAV